MKKDIQQYNKGFTMVEALVAVAIFSFSLTAIIFVSGRSVSDVNISKNRLAATYLGQEGIEMIRNFRDTNIITDPVGGFDAFVLVLDNSECTSSAGCNINASDFPTSPSSFVACSNISACNISGTNFSRIIKVSKINSSLIKVTSTVNWSKDKIINTVSMTENLFNIGEQVQ